MTTSAHPPASAAALRTLLHQRRSTRAFDTAREVAPDVLVRVLEAARWAPSSGNAQPWTYVVTDRRVPAARSAAQALLRPSNAWAEAAPVLLLATAARDLPAKRDKPTTQNPHAWHDVGAASLALCLQATAEGLVAHQLAGFDRGGAAAAFGLPDGVEAVTLIALGYPGDGQALPAELAAREGRAERRPLGEVARLGTWQGPTIDAHGTGTTGGGAG